MDQPSTNKQFLLAAGIVAQNAMQFLGNSDSNPQSSKKTPSIIAPRLMSVMGVPLDVNSYVDKLKIAKEAGAAKYPEDKLNSSNKGNSDCSDEMFTKCNPILQNEKDLSKKEEVLNSIDAAFESNVTQKFDIIGNFRKVLKVMKQKDSKVSTLGQKILRQIEMRQETNESRKSSLVALSMFDSAQVVRRSCKASLVETQFVSPEFSQNSESRDAAPMPEDFIKARSGFGMSRFGNTSNKLLKETVGLRRSISQFQRGSDKDKQNASQPVIRITMGLSANEVDWSKNGVS
jgi:hypothetical protein